MDACAQVVGERAGLLQETFRSERQPLDPDVDLDTAVGGAVGGLVGGLVVLERVQVVLVVRDVVPQDRADADLLGRASQRTQLAVHVVHGGDPALDRFAVAGERGPVGLLGVQRSDDRIPAGLQVLPEREVVAPALADGRVEMQVHQTRHHRLPLGVDDLGAVGAVAGGHVGAGAHIHDAVPFDHHGAAEDDVVGVVHRDDGSVPDDDAIAHGCSPSLALNVRSPAPPTAPRRSDPPISTSSEDTAPWLPRRAPGRSRSACARRTERPRRTSHRC